MTRITHAAVEEMSVAFSIARSNAIDAYAGLEVALGKLFAFLTKTDDAAAHMIFYRIGANQRSALLSGLIELRFRRRCDVFCE